MPALWLTAGDPAFPHRWEPARVTPPGEQFTPQERNAIWEHAAQAAADASARIRSHAASNPAAAADAAWATADTLHVAAAALGSRVLREAADAYDRAARAPYGRIPRPTAAGNSLRHTARLLAAAVAVTDDNTLVVVTLITRLAALAEAVAELRHVQRHAAQAAAACRAAEYLRAATPDHRIPPSGLSGPDRGQLPSWHDWTTRSHSAWSHASPPELAQINRPVQVPGQPTGREARPDSPQS